MWLAKSISRVANSSSINIPTSASSEFEAASLAPSCQPPSDSRISVTERQLTLLEAAVALSVSGCDSNESVCYWDARLPPPPPALFPRLVPLYLPNAATASTNNNYKPTTGRDNGNAKCTSVSFFLRVYSLSSPLANRLQEGELHQWASTLEQVLSQHLFQSCNLFVSLDEEAHKTTDSSNESTFRIYQHLLVDCMTCSRFPNPQVCPSYGQNPSILTFHLGQCLSLSVCCLGNSAQRIHLTFLFHCLSTP